MLEPNRRGWRSDDRRWGVHVEMLWANLSHSVGGKTSKSVQHFCKKLLWLFYFGFTGHFVLTAFLLKHRK
jgi:hypothetical protein